MARRNPEGRMRLVEHFAEFRRRLILIAAGFLVGAIISWFLADFVFELLRAPLVALEARGIRTELNFSEVTGPFSVRLRISFFIAVFLTAPWWMYQLWAFLAPGLRRTEKRYVLLFIGGGVPLFLGGAALGVWILPHAVQILMGMLPEGGTGFTNAREYLTFAQRLIMAFGLAFLFPVVLVGLNVAGVMRGKTMLKGWRWAIMLMFLFGAIANPLPDPWSMLLLGGSMTLLYFTTVGFALLNDRRRDKKRAKLLAQ